MSSTTTQINQLPPVSVPGAQDAFPVQQVDGVTRYATPDQILNAAGGATTTQASATQEIALNASSLAGVASSAASEAHSIASASSAQAGQAFETANTSLTIAGAASVNASTALETANTASSIAGAASVTAANANSIASAASVQAAGAVNVAGAASILASGAIQASAPVANAPISNPNTLTESYTIPGGHNAISIGPYTVAPGTTLMLPDGSTWRVI